MFSDQPVTPKRLEILIDVIADYSRSSTLRRDQLLELLQPETLPDYGNSRVVGEQTLHAARDLGLIEEVDGGLIIVEKYRDRRGRSTREVVLAAIDERVLSSSGVEPYFAPFYSYILGLGLAADVSRDYQEWANAYNHAVHQGVPTRNPLNETKVRGLRRWFPYTGLGWSDTRDIFQCEPYERVRRVLPQIFGTERRLQADDFAARLAEVCPELDGGRIFQVANVGAAVGGRVFTLGVAQALIGLHEDGVIVLDCPPDSRGWDLSAAEPPNDGATLRSARLDAVEWVPNIARQTRRALEPKL